MDRGVKLALAVGVLLSGASLASLFRHPAPLSEPMAEAGSNSLRLRGQPSPEVLAHTESDSPDRISASPFGTVATWPAIAPLDSGAPPPPLAKAYPEDPITGARWGGSLGLDTTQLSRAERIHVIVDGDTLTALAAQYLGNADRYLEIYEANRSQLPSPGELPIGAELRIPLQPLH